MTVRDIVVIALAGLLLIGFWAVKKKKKPIEDLLTRETLAAFEEFNVDTSMVTVSFDGRDAVLRGRVTSMEEKNRVEGIVEEEVWDVRKVDNWLAVEETRSENGSVIVVQANSSFGLVQAEDGSINVAGKVHNERGRDQILRAVEGAFPESAVKHTLEVSTEIDRPSWFPSILALVPTVGLVENPKVDIEVGGSIIKLGGEVVGEQQRDAILIDATQAVGAPYELVADIRVMATEVVDEDPEIAAFRRRIETLLKTTRIQFRINTAELVPLSKQVLDDVIRVLKEAPELQIEVQGHTDNTGSNAFNRELSKARANAVREYLIANEIAADHLTAVGYGPTRPVATNTTLEGRIMNRRVVFSLQGGS